MAKTSRQEDGNENAEPTPEDPTPERMIRETVALVGQMIEEAVAANKRPFFVSAASAQRLSAAFDELVEAIVSDDGTIDTDAEEIETLKEFVTILKALK